MPTAQRLRQLRYRVKELIERDFSGGPNIRDAASELASNEAVDSWNVTYDERGAVGARRGYAKYNSGGVYGGGLVKNIFYSGVISENIVQAGASIYKGTNTAAVKTFSTSARVGFADFAGKLCVIHPVDGLFTSTDGSTWTAGTTLQTVTITIASPAVCTTPAAHGLAVDDPVIFQTTGALPTGITAGTQYFVISAGLTATSFEISATKGGAAINTSGSQSGTHTLYWGNAPVGNVLLPWQNKLFATGDPAHGPRFQWSKAGDPARWQLNDFNDVREKDDAPLVALAGSSGVDIQGRQGFLAFKRRSTYRVFSSTTGEYATTDTTVGAASALSVVTIGQKTITLCERGVYWTDGIGPMQEVSSKFLPLWDSSQINFTNLDLFCAGRRGNRAHFSLCRAGSSANDFAFEFHPEQGWLAPGSNAMSCYTAYGLNTETLEGGSPTVSGQAYSLYTGGTDDGTAISSRFQSRWYEPAVGFLSQLWEIRLELRGSFTMAVRKDYATVDYQPQQVSAPASGSFYDAGNRYDTGVTYASPGSQATVGLFGWGVCRQFSVRITATTTTTMIGDPLFAQGSGPQLGAWALYGVSALYLPLGYA